MKKIFMCIMVVVVMMLFPITVYATETSNAEGNMRCTNGTVWYDNYQVEQADIEYTVDSDAYMYIENHIFCNDSGVEYHYYYLYYYGNMTSVTSEYDWVEKTESYSNVKEPFTQTYNNTGESCFLILNCYDMDLFNSSIPIFEVATHGQKTEDILNYITNGDYSGASNADDLEGAYDYDDIIPLPHNFRVIQGTDQTISGVESAYTAKYNHDVVVTWEQEDVLDNMQFEIMGQHYAYRMNDSDATKISEHSGPWCDFVKKTNYDGVTSMTVQIGKDILNGSKESGYLSKLKLRVRNIVNNKTSNWVTITIDLKNKTATATEEGYEDETITGGNEYNDTTIANGNNDGSVSVGGFMKYITSGFGLLGDGGIIALMSSVFLYLPNSLWSIILMYISACCVVALFAFTIKVVF